MERTKHSKWKGALAAVIAIAMVACLLPTDALNVFAEEKSASISSYVDDNPVYTASVEQGTSLDEVGLPETLQAVVVSDSAVGNVGVTKKVEVSWSGDYDGNTPGKYTLTAEAKDYEYTGEEDPTAVITVVASGNSDTGTIDNDSENDSENNAVSSDQTTTLTSKGSNYIITVTYGADAGLPDGVSLKASEYSKASSTFQDRYAEAAEMYGWDEEDEDLTDCARLFNVSLYADGNEVEPEAAVQVSITYTNVEADDDTEYAVVHFGDEMEVIDPEVLSYNNKPYLNFEVTGFSDIMLLSITEDGYSYWEADELWENTNIKTGNLQYTGSLEDFVGQSITGSNGATFNVLEDVTNTSNLFTNEKIQLSMTNVSMEGSSSYISLEKYDSQKTLILLDVSQYEATGSKTVGGKGDRIADMTFDENLQGTGKTFEQSGGLATLRFSNVGVIDGVAVDILVTIKSVHLYQSFALNYAAYFNDTTTSSAYGHVGVKDGEISIGYVNNGTGGATPGLGIGQNYPSSAATYTDRYSDSFYTYPCIQDVDLSIKVVKSNTDQQVDRTYYMTASDIDVYYGKTAQSTTENNGISFEKSDGTTQDNTSSPPGWKYGFFAETFKMYNPKGTYYIYGMDSENIYLTSDAVWSQASGFSETSGASSYTTAGIIAETNGGSWDIGYGEGWCSTMLEIDTDTDIIVQKVEDGTTTTLDGAEFILSTGSGTSTQYYTWSEDVSGTYTHGWTSNENEAVPVTTGTIETVSGDTLTGAAFFRDLDVGTYTLTETKAPAGYELLDSSITVTIAADGTIAVSGENVSVVTENNIVRIRVSDEPLTTDVELTKVDGYTVSTDENGNNLTADVLEGAKFILYKTEGESTTYYVRSDETGSDGKYTITWSSTRDNATTLTSDGNGLVHIDELEIGTYILEEITAPDGYMLPVKNTWTIVVTQDTDDNGELLQSLSYTITGDILLQSTDEDDEGNEVTTYYIPNYEIYELPSTGGPGSQWPIICGAILMIFGAGFWMSLRRRPVRRR